MGAKHKASFLNLKTGFPSQEVWTGYPLLQIHLGLSSRPFLAPSSPDLGCSPSKTGLTPFLFPSSGTTTSTIPVRLSCCPEFLKGSMCFFSSCRGQKRKIYPTNAMLKFTLKSFVLSVTLKYIRFYNLIVYILFLHLHPHMLRSLLTVTVCDQEPRVRNSRSKGDGGQCKMLSHRHEL